MSEEMEKKEVRRMEVLRKAILACDLTLSEAAVPEELDWLTAAVAAHYADMALLMAQKNLLRRDFEERCQSLAK